MRDATFTVRIANIFQAAIHVPPTARAAHKLPHLAPPLQIVRMRFDLNDDSTAGDAVPSIDFEVSDLGIVFIHPHMFKRIQSGLKKIVDITATAIRWLEVDRDSEFPEQWWEMPMSQSLADALAELASLTADERFSAHMPPVAVDAGRKRKCEMNHEKTLPRSEKFRHGTGAAPLRRGEQWITPQERFQGGVLFWACCGCPEAASFLA